MAEQTQIQQLTRKDTKKVKQGKRLGEHNPRKREELKAQKRERDNNPNYYGAGAVVALGVLGVISYYVYQSKTPVHQPKETLVNRPKKNPANKFDMDLLGYKMDKKSIVNDFYQAVVISVFAVGYSMLGKKILKIAPPSTQKFDLEDTGKLVVIVAASGMYLIKQKILPEHIGV